jgi:hypothetical protein
MYRWYLFFNALYYTGLSLIRWVLYSLSVPHFYVWMYLSITLCSIIFMILPFSSTAMYWPPHRYTGNVLEIVYECYCSYTFLHIIDAPFSADCCDVLFAQSANVPCIWNVPCIEYFVTLDTCVLLLTYQSGRLASDLNHTCYSDARLAIIVVLSVVSLRMYSIYTIFVHFLPSILTILWW